METRLRKEESNVVTGLDEVQFRVQIARPGTREENQGRLFYNIVRTDREGEDITSRKEDLFEFLGQTDEGTNTHLPALNALITHILRRVNDEALEGLE